MQEQSHEAVPPAARWLVDGMNVVGSRPDRWWEDRPRAMRDLVMDLERYAARTGEEITVVFDGRSSSLTPSSSDAVAVHFAGRARGSADEKIVDRVSHDRDPGSLTVVTSDKDLARRVGERGVRSLSAGEFRGLLEM